MTPMRVATIPHTSVRVGSHIFGDVLLRIILQGIYLKSDWMLLSYQLKLLDLEKYVANEVQSQAREVLVTRHSKVGRETLNSRVGNCSGTVSIRSSSLWSSGNEPLLRSRKLSRYKMDTAGSNLRSIFRISAFSLIPLVSTSLESSDGVRSIGTVAFSSLGGNFSSAGIGSAMFKDPDCWKTESGRKTIQ